MSKSKTYIRDPLYIVEPLEINSTKKLLGQLLMWGTFSLMIILAIIQYMKINDRISFGFETWRPILYAYILWAFSIGYSRVLIYGEKGKRSLFVIPAVLFIISIVIFPLVFGLYVSFTDWNLSSFEGRKYNGLDNFYQMLSDPYYWNALYNMLIYIFFVIIEFAIAFGLALLLNANIVGRKFFRVSFLLPLMLRNLISKQLKFSMDF